MILSKNERNIAIGAAAFVVLLIMWFTVFGPWLDGRESYAAQIAEANQQLQSNQDLLRREAKLSSDWKKMLANGLQSDETEAQILTLTALTQWAPMTGVQLDAVKPDLPKTQGAFEIVGFGLTGEGSTRSISLLLWDLEHAGIPLRVNDVLIQPRPEGTDNLTFSIHISTLCLAPPQANRRAEDMGGES